jgi:hypothetical protein
MPVAEILAITASSAEIGEVIVQMVKEAKRDGNRLQPLVDAAPFLRRAFRDGMVIKTLISNGRGT